MALAPDPADSFAGFKPGSWEDIARRARLGYALKAGEGMALAAQIDELMAQLAVVTEERDDARTERDQAYYDAMGDDL